MSPLSWSQYSLIEIKDDLLTKTWKTVGLVCKHYMYLIGIYETLTLIKYECINQVPCITNYLV